MNDATKPTKVNSKPGVLKFSASMLLVGLLVLLVTAPFVRMCPDGDLIETSLFTLILISAVLAVGGRRRILLVAVLLVGPAVLGRWTEHFWQGVLPHGFVAVAAIVSIAFVIVMLLRFVLRARHVNSEVLCAAVSNYLLLGFLWAFAYAAVENLSPGSFCYEGAPSTTANLDMFALFYFSLVTLCTVGYGDISPLSNSARMLAVIEAITGTFYMTILIARLVAVYSFSPPSEDQEKPPAS